MNGTGHMVTHVDVEGSGLEIFRGARFKQVLMQSFGSLTFLPLHQDRQCGLDLLRRRRLGGVAPIAAGLGY
jgi:hypothetical protein